IAPAEPSPRLDAYLRWIKAGMHGKMGYMARPDRVVRRRDPTVILPRARSLVVVALDYFTLPQPVTDDPRRGRVSNYAWGVDYHDVMLPRLEELAAFIEAQISEPTAYRAYVDTGAILERSHAQQAGLGFVGKNTMLIHPQRGSFFFLGEIITDAALPFDDPPQMPDCGTCTRCLEACPTDAFPEPYVLDARRCISYLTIELKGWVPRELRPLMGSWVYGCDICQTVCPWQRFTQPTSIPEFAMPDLDRAAPRLAELLVLTGETFAERYAGAPIRRIKRERLVRNACIAAGNSGLPEFSEQLIPLLTDASPLVRGHAAWALGQLGEGYEALHQVDQTDPLVADEIIFALEAMQ
ncbi:MAG: tRNA epoxyqueuosine(34) reductase QueG, partial [Anaerolineae bacterium]